MPTEPLVPYLIRAGFRVLDDGPGLAILAVCHFKGADKLHAPKVFCTLRDDTRNLLGRL